MKWSSTGVTLDLVQRLRLAQRECWLRGERRLVEQFLQDHPTLADDRDGVLDFIYSEFCLREELKQAATEEEYVARFPQFADRLAPLFALHRAMMAAGDSASSDASLAALGQSSTSSSSYRPNSVSGDQDHGAAVGRAPKRLGKFELIDACGQGAFGTVYRARDTTIDRIVALKVPRTGRLATTEDEDRFLREAKAAAQLRDERIVRVFEAGRIDGTPYIASEFVDGTTLADVLKQGQLPRDDAVEVVRQIASALQVAHSLGVVHRDIKPANVMLAANSSGASSLPPTPKRSSAPSILSVRLMDFGLAHQDARESLVTVDGQIVGTPSYMSPEQARGDSRSVDGRSDVFSLGVVFYQLLTGELPFAGNMRMVLQQVLESDPRPVRRLDDAVPLDLETICHKCLEKAPERRYATAGELADDLTRYQGGFPVRARPVSSLEKAVRWVRRHRVVAALSASILAVLILGIAGTTWQLLATLRAERARTMSQVTRLQEAPAESAPGLLDELDAYADDVASEVRAKLADPDLDADRRVRLQLFLLRQDAGVAAELFDAMLRTRLTESALIAGELSRSGAKFTPEAGRALEQFDADRPAALRAALYLANVETSAESWLTHREAQVVAALVGEILVHTDEYGTAESAFAAVRDQLTPALRAASQDAAAGEASRRIATSLLLAYTEGKPEEMLTTLLDADPQQLEMMFQSLAAESRDRVAELAERVARGEPVEGLGPAPLKGLQAANAALAAVYWGRREAARPVLTESSDRSARSFFIDRCAPAGVEAAALVEWLQAESDPFVRAALLLALGTYQESAMPRSTRVEAGAAIDSALDSAQDAGEWAAAAWAIRQWNPDFKETTRVGEPTQTTASRKSGSSLLGPNGHLLHMLGAGRLPVSPGRRVLPDGRQSSKPRPDAVGAAFALAAFETTIGQYREFEPGWTLGEIDSEDEACPVYAISGQKAAEYCNWLSQQAKLPEAQWCYVPSAENPEFLESAPDFLKRRGYRLPTETEWEYACRAGTATQWHFADDEALLPNYAWCPQNSTLGGKHPVGLKMPNDNGFFDLYGNADEICDDDPGGEYPIRPGGYFVTKGGAAGDVISTGSGGGNLAQNDPQQVGGVATGFRVCRTMFEDDGVAPAAAEEAAAQ